MEIQWRQVLFKSPPERSRNRLRRLKQQTKQHRLHWGDVKTINYDVAIAAKQHQEENYVVSIIRFEIASLIGSPL